MRGDGGLASCQLNRCEMSIGVGTLALLESIILRYQTRQLHHIRRILSPQRKDIGDIDTLIAATALEHNLKLVTIDTDFERVLHLKVQLVNLKPV